jgi:hypothetical protein
VTFRSNLPQPRQHLAFRCREFLAIDILGEQRGIMLMPWGDDIEITSATNAHEQKFVEAKYALNPSADIADMKVGESPVRIHISLRKGSNPGNDNKSVLRMTFPEFETLLQRGRAILRMLMDMEGEEFDSFEQIQLPGESMIRVRAPEMNNGQTTFVLLSVSLIKHNQTSNTVRPMVSVREYIEDKKNKVYVPTSRGISVGLRAFYNVMYPVAFAIRKRHDAYLQVYISKQSDKTICYTNNISKYVGYSEIKICP